MVLDEKNKKSISKMLSDVDSLNMVLVSNDSQTSQVAEELFSQVAEAGDLELRIISPDSKEAKDWNIAGQPTLLFEKAPGVRFMGLPSGHEFRNFIETISMVANGKTDLDDKVKKELGGITSKVDLKIFVTPTCPYCPPAVRTGHKLALENKNITSTMIEATQFRELSMEHDVSGVPKIVINDDSSFTGAAPAHAFLKKIKQAL